MKAQVNYPPIVAHSVGALIKMAFFAMLVAVGVFLSPQKSAAQTATNAFDQASDPAYAGMGAPNGLATGGQNGGFGFGPWTFTLMGTGGSFIQNNGPSGDSFDLWNTSANSSTVAVRPFTSAITPGQSFLVSLRLNSLDNSSDTNRFALEDASGNILFSYWQVGGDNLNGWYSDGTTNNGLAVNFQYAYQQFVTFKFTLNNATNYTFADLNTGGTFTGTISNTPIAQASFIRANGGTAPSNGQDYQIDQLTIISAAPPLFQSQFPGPFSAATNTAISVSVVSGGVPLNTNSVSLKLDGDAVSPTITGNSSLMSISYTPSSPFACDTTHTVQVTLAESNGALYTNAWSFTTAFGSLPSVLPGPIVASNQESGIVIFSTNDAWMGANYGAFSGKTIYARFSMEFDNLNGETGPGGSDGGGYGGLHFFLGGINGTPHVIAGNNWPSTNWSVDYYTGQQSDLTPVTPIVFHEWHTIVERIDLVPGNNANVSLWLDPDFTQTEANQPNPPLTASVPDTFDTLVLRTGNGTCSATFSNIVVAATSAGVGFAAPATPQFIDLVPANNDSTVALSTPISAQVVFGTYGIGTNTVVLTLDGNDVTPTFAVATNSITVNYQPPTPFVAGSAHTVTLSVTDSNGTPYSTTWSFTVDPYPSLPVSMAGPFDVSDGLDVTLWNSQNEWIGNNYGTDSTNTLYTRFSMVFYDFPQTTNSAGGSYGGLHFFEDNTERLLVGNAWLSTNWSVDAKEAGELDLSPAVPIVVGDWHTFVIQSVYSSNAPTAESIWIDPDFTKSLDSQQTSLTTSMNNTFDQVRLRCGNGETYAEFTNIVMAATAEALGFPPSVAPSLLSIQNGQLSWTGAGTLQSAPAVTGPWTDATDQSNPQALSTTNAAEFYRLRQ